MKAEPEMKKTKSCKLMCMLLVLAMLLGLFAGCTARGGEATNPPATTEPTQSGGPDVTEPSGGEDTMEPTGTEPADPGATEPTVIDPSDATEPTDFTGPADVTDPSDPTEPTPPVVTEPGHEHEYGKTVTAATCTEDGFATYTCKGCGDSYVGELTPAVGHKYGEWTTTEEPTEAAEGAAERTCSTCGAKETKVLDKLIPNHTHSYTGKVTKKATCSAEGVKTYTCSCGGSYTESISKLGHSYKNTVTAPTCTTQGYTTHKCSTCGDSYKDTYVAMVSHKYGSYTSNGDATCTKDGTKTAKCSVCGGKDTQKDTGSAKGHSYKSTVTAPTCTEKGYTTNKCGVCGDSYKDNFTDTVDHDYVVTSVREPSMSIEGYTTYICTTCGDSYKADFVPVIPQEEFERMVADATVKYINQFREEQGDTEAVKLPGLTQVAEYRAVQLQEKFEHSFAASREAFAYYQYGEYVDATEYGDDASNSYWSANAKEAIGKGTGGSSTPADELGRMFAEDCRNSAGHWDYVGSSDYTYIGIGTTYSQNGWRICILQTKINYG